MKTCSSCRWWRKGECELIGESPSAKRSEDDAQLHVEVSDDYGLSVSLRTGPNFGCTLHEDKS